MANLDQIQKLNRRYGKQSPIADITKSFSINEALDPDNIKKALSRSIANLGPEFSMYFELGLPAEIALLFIDVCGFSTRFGSLNGDDIARYFDEYYDKVIPIIYDHHGEIDKVIGDGIVCIFGPPFMSGDLNQCISKADKCAKEIIEATNGTKFSSKVAFHCGSINYFKNKTGLYKEFTIIGKPLTELFRLESISIDNEINYYDGTLIRDYYNKRIAASASSTSSHITWLHSEGEIGSLRGVSYRRYYHISYNEK